MKPDLSGMDRMTSAGAQQRREAYYNRQGVSVHTAMDVLQAEMDELSSGSLSLQEIVERYGLTNLVSDSAEDQFALMQAMQATLDVLKPQENTQGQGFTLDTVGGYLSEALQGRL